MSANRRRGDPEASTVLINWNRLAKALLGQSLLSFSLSIFFLFLYILTVLTISGFYSIFFPQFVVFFGVRFHPRVNLNDHKMALKHYLASSLANAVFLFF